MDALFPPLSQLLAEYLTELKRVLPDVEQVFLFGSQARGDAGPLSDVDLLVVAPSFAGMNVIDRALCLAKANRRLLPVEPIGVTPGEIAGARPGSFLEEALRGARVLELPT